MLKDGAIAFKYISYNDKKCNFKIKRNLIDSAKQNAVQGLDVFYLQDLYSAKKVLADGQPLIISIRLGTGFSAISNIKYNGQNIIWKNFGQREAHMRWSA